MNKKFIAAITICTVIATSILTYYGVNAGQITREEKQQMLKTKVLEIEELDKELKSTGEAQTQKERDINNEKGNKMKTKMTEVENLAKEVDNPAKIDEREEVKRMLLNFREFNSLDLNALKQHRSEIKNADIEISKLEENLKKIEKLQDDFDKGIRPVAEIKEDLLMMKN